MSLHGGTEINKAIDNSFKAGYREGLKDSEMLEMLNILLYDYKNYTQNIMQDSHRNNRINEIEQLIKQATEL